MGNGETDSAGLFKAIASPSHRRRSFSELVALCSSRRFALVDDDSRFLHTSNYLGLGFYLSTPIFTLLPVS